MPDELARLVLVHTRGEELKPVARISTSRRRQLLLDSAGGSLAEVASDDVTAQALGSQTRVSQWHEVEVELTGGNRDVLAAADALLRRDGLSRSAQSAKLARALGVPPPEPSGQQSLGASAPAGRVLLAYLGEQICAAEVTRPDGARQRAGRGAPDADHGPAAAQHPAGLQAVLQRFRNRTAGC